MQCVSGPICRNEACQKKYSPSSGCIYANIKKAKVADPNNPWMKCIGQKAGTCLDKKNKKLSISFLDNLDNRSESYRACNVVSKYSLLDVSKYHAASGRRACGSGTAARYPQYVYLVYKIQSDISKSAGVTGKYLYLLLQF